MMLRRYSDAIRIFSQILVFISRTKNFQKNQADSVICPHIHAPRPHV